jgi:mono/diheme cytochrome c family protein
MPETIMSKKHKGARAAARRLVLAGYLGVSCLFWFGPFSAEGTGGEGTDEYYQLGRGKRVYEQYCRFCHGDQGKGAGYALATPTPPDLTSTAIRKMTDAELLAIIHGGSPGTDMAAWNWALSERDKQDVVAYIRSLSRGGQ